MTTAFSFRVQRIDRNVAPQQGQKVAFDRMAIVRIYLIALVFSPAIYVVGPLGSAGTPAGILGCIMLVLWLLERVARTERRMRSNPVNWVAGGFAVAALFSFCAAMTRPAVAAEVTASQRSLISVASWLGVILYVSDTMRTGERLRAFLKFAVLVASGLAAMGILQFIGHFDFVSLLHLPGLSENAPAGGVYQRAGYVRVAATASHSIEFSAVLGMILPAAISLAVEESHRRLWQWAQVMIIVAAFPLTVARSGMISLALGLVFALVIMRPRQRLLLILVLPIGAVLFRTALPGFLSVLRDLFTNAGADSSVSARVADYTALWHYFLEAPLFGRGLFTFLPTVYRTFDNQYLGTLVEAGIVGLVSLAALLLVPMAVSIRVAASDSSLRLIAAAITAGTIVAGVIFYTFDAMGFPMAAGMFCAVVGAAGGLWRSHQGEEQALFPDVQRFAAVSMPVGRRIALVSLITLVGGASLLNAVHARDVYEADVSMVVRVGNRDAPNVYDERSSTFGVPYILEHVMESQQVADALARKGISFYSTAVGNGSLAPYTDILGSGDRMSLATRSNSGAGAEKNAAAVLATMKAELARIQNSQAEIVEPEVVIADVGRTNVFPVAVHMSSALVGYLFLFVLLWQFGSYGLGSRWRLLLREMFGSRRE